MSSTVKKLTGMGRNARQIAKLLQAKAPAGHMLAYINDEEAALLKSRGGKGTPHADTGIPSFELDDSFALQGDASGGPSEVAPTAATYGGDINSSNYDIGFGPGAFAPSAPQAPTGGMDTQLSSFPQPVTQTPTPDAARLQEAGGRQLAELTGQPEAKTPGEDKGLSKDTLARLGLAGGLGVIGATTARRAAQQGQAGAQATQALATPYQQQGQQLQAQAQRGELTPAAQQSLQAMQAQVAQGVQNRGGVGVAQAQAQIEQFRQQLLAQQYDYGLKLSGIGDNIALGAIKTGLQADQYVNQLNNSFYTNMAYIASGMSPGARG
jgi:hypothetical protein